MLRLVRGWVPHEPTPRLSVYIVDAATGIFLAYQNSRPLNTLEKYGITANSGILYTSLAVFLNVLLTSMIVVRLFLHSWKFRNAIGTSAMTGGLYNTIVAMLVESCALYTIVFLVFIGLRAADNPVSNTFLPLLIQVQVRGDLACLWGLPTLKSCYLTTVLDRPSLLSSSPCELQTREHQRLMLPLGTPVRFALGTMETRQVKPRPFSMGVPRVREMPQLGLGSQVAITKAVPVLRYGGVCRCMLLSYFVFVIFIL